MSFFCLDFSIYLPVYYPLKHSAMSKRSWVVGKEGEVGFRDMPAFVFKNGGVSENIEVPEEIEGRRGIVEETKLLEKVIGRDAFLRLKGDSPDFLRGSACLWAVGTQVLLPGRTPENSGHRCMRLVGVLCLSRGARASAGVPQRSHWI